MKLLPRALFLYVGLSLVVSVMDLRLWSKVIAYILLYISKKENHCISEEKGTLKIS